MGTLTMMAVCGVCLARSLATPAFQVGDRWVPASSRSPDVQMPSQTRTQGSPATSGTPPPGVNSLENANDLDSSLETPGAAKKVTTRQVAFQAYIPFIAFPPFFRLSDFVVLSTPRELVYPPCSPTVLQMPTMRPTTPSTTPSTTPTTDIGRGGELDNRLGEGNVTSSAEPSRCVWAIVACCSPGSRNIRYSCFELLGCPGGFWDFSPCEDRVVMSAANSALNFYMQRANTTQAPPEDPGLDNI